MKKTTRIIATAITTFIAGIAFAAPFLEVFNGSTITDVNAQEVYEDIAQFPESYRTALYALKEKHPNWTFQVYDTGLDWSEVIYNELNPASRSLLPSYFDSSMVGDSYGDGWSYATPYAVQYYLDPRNWLTEDYIFQFEELTYNAETQGLVTVQKDLMNTFMSGYIQTDSQYNYEQMGLTYAQAFRDIGESIGVSPVHLATRVKQEQGTQGTSDLISGEYPGYEGYYNYYNIQASGATHEEIVANGLNEARSEGWNSRYAALYGGSQKVANRYILRGQDTLYFQKFDVDGQYDGRYWHQYMQNLAAPSNEGRNTKRAYEKADMLNEAFVFKIPVYNNMPNADNASQIMNEGKYYIESTDSKYAITTASDTGVVSLSEMEYDSSLQWMLMPIDDKYYVIKLINEDRYIMLSEEGFAGGISVVANILDGNIPETAKWYIKEETEGNYNICSKYNGMYLSFANSEAGATANVYTKDSSKTQTFVLHEITQITEASQYMMSHDDNGIIIGLTTATNKESADLEYYWEIRDADNDELAYYSSWVKNNEWLIWQPIAFKNYRVYGCVRPIDDPESVAYTVSVFEHHPKIIGICQMPYEGEGGGFLIGVETVDNPEQSYSYEMLILDCTLLAEGKDAWVYDTGKFTVSEGKAGWTIWQPKYGYYWTLFRIFDSEGNMIDEQCYGFANVY